MAAKYFRLQMRARDEPRLVRDDWWPELLNPLILYGIKANSWRKRKKATKTCSKRTFLKPHLWNLSLVVGGGSVFRSLRWAKHSITASLPPGLLWENVKNRTPHFTDSHIKRCQVQPRESSIGGWAAPVEQQEFKRRAERKSLSERCNMFILTTPAESESQTWKTCTAIPSAVMVLWDKTPFRTESTWNDAGFSLFLAHL